MSEAATAELPTTRVGRARVRLTLVGLFRAPAPVRCARRERKGRAALAWFVAVALLVHLLAFAALDLPWPNLRDPEYGMRLPRLRARVAEHPARPAAVVVGSSRACMGVKPSVWEAVRPGGERDPLLFNFSTVGAGPIQQLITVRRLFADGARPAVVLLEYWPPLLRQDGKYDEQVHVDRRLRYDDLPVVRDYFPDPERAERMMRGGRLHALHANRDRWLVRLAPRWVMPHQRADITWREMDGWGWLPGFDVRPDDPALRRVFLDHVERGFRERLDGWSIHPNSDRALREAVAVARAHGARVGFVVLPESSETRGWYPPAVERAGREHFAALCRELNVPAIDAREWMPDEYLADGHHLSRAGAAAFTPRLGAAVRATFPDVGVNP